MPFAPSSFLLQDLIQKSALDVTVIACRPAMASVSLHIFTENLGAILKIHKGDATRGSWPYY